MQLTKAQQNLIDRAKRLDVPASWVDTVQSREQRGLDYIVEACKASGKPFAGATYLKGSADYRVAYKLAELGLGRLSTALGVDGSYFVYNGPARCAACCTS